MTAFELATIEAAIDGGSREAFIRDAALAAARRINAKRAAPKAPAPTPPVEQPPVAQPPKLTILKSADDVREALAARRK